MKKIKKLSIDDFKDNLKLSNEQLCLIVGGGNDNDDHDDLLLGQPKRTRIPAQ